MALPEVNIRGLFEAGVYFGHLTNRWNPKMAPYIFGSRQGIHIIDLNKTLPMLQHAMEVLAQVARDGGHILFVGTKMQCRASIAEAAEQAGQFYVNYRWLGGMLTNWSTVMQSIGTLKAVEEKLSAEDVSKYTKRERAALERTRNKLTNIFRGIREMYQVPDLMVLMDTVGDRTAVLEAQKLNIPSIGIVDTNADPTMVTYPVPGNDDSVKSLRLYSNLFASAVLEGLSSALEGQSEGAEKTAEADSSPEQKKTSPSKVTRKKASSAGENKKTPQKREVGASDKIASKQPEVAKEGKGKKTPSPSVEAKKVAPAKTAAKQDSAKASATTPNENAGEKEAVVVVKKKATRRVSKEKEDVTTTQAAREDEPTETDKKKASKKPKAAAPSGKDSNKPTKAPATKEKKKKETDTTKVPLQLVRELREKTGAGIMDVRDALRKTNLDANKAVDWLRERGLQIAKKKSSRTAAEGVIGVCVDNEGKRGVLLEINTETDFVARNEQFQKFAQKVTKILLENDATSLDNFVKLPFDGEMSVETALTQTIAALGENVVLRRFVRKEGDVVGHYVHSQLTSGLGKIGVLVALKSEGDKDDTLKLAENLAIHVAALSPEYVSREDVPPSVVDHERHILSEQLKNDGKDPAVVEKIVKGRLEKFYRDAVLQEQTYFVDGKTKIQKLLEDFGHPVQILGFSRYLVGEGIEKKAPSLVEEVQETVESR